MTDTPDFPKPDLKKLFMIDDESVQTRTMINALGHHIRMTLKNYPQMSTLSFQINREVAAKMAEIFILDE